MNDELIEHKSWWKRNWKWLVPFCGISIIAITTFFSSGMGGIMTDFAQAYADTELYSNAIERLNSEQKVTELLGQIEPLNKMAILEGETDYSNNNQTVNATVQIAGTKGKARMDITADRINNEWNYSRINVRIKNPPEKKQTIKIKTAE
ncbi:MAG: cytochrome c oxidase assembly factor Coa1 family protein [Bacteroidota bacterium]